MTGIVEDEWLELRMVVLPLLLDPILRGHTRHLDDTLLEVGPLAGEGFIHALPKLGVAAS